MRDFDKSFKRTQRIFWTAFTVISLLTISGYFFVGYTISKVIQDPDGTAKTVGKNVGTIVKSFNEGMNDTTTINY